MLRLASSLVSHLDAAVGNLGTIGTGSRGFMKFAPPGMTKRTVFGDLRFREERGKQ